MKISNQYINTYLFIHRETIPLQYDSQTHSLYQNEKIQVYMHYSNIVWPLSLSLLKLEI